MCRPGPFAVEQQQQQTPTNHVVLGKLRSGEVRMDSLEEDVISPPVSLADRQPDSSFKTYGPLSDAAKGVESFDSLSALADEPKVEEVQSKQRKTVELWPVGSQVEIYSASRQCWIPDGEVVEVVWESCMRDDNKVSAGSTKIVYDHGARFKWVASHRLPALVRESRRLRKPTPWTGHLLISFGLFGLNKWVYVEVYGGVLRWFSDETQAEVARSSSDVSPGGGFGLLGMQVEKKGMNISVRTNGTRFQALRAMDADAFTAALRVHARYCEKDTSFLAATFQATTAKSSPL